MKPLPPAGAGVLLAVLYVSAILFGLAEVLRDNAAQTLMPSVVSKDNLEKANGRLWGAEMVTNSFIGPPLGGFLLAVAFSLPFFVDAGTFAVSAAMVALLAGSFRPQVKDSSAPRPSFVTDLKEGFRWLWNHRLLRTLAIVLGLLNAAGERDHRHHGSVCPGGADTSTPPASGCSPRPGQWAESSAAFGASAVSKALGSRTVPRRHVRRRDRATSIVIGLTSSATLVWAMFAIGTFSAVALERDHRFAPTGHHPRPPARQGQQRLSILRLGNDADRHISRWAHWSQIVTGLADRDLGSAGTVLRRRRSSRSC